MYELVAGLEPDLGALEGRDFIRRRSTSSLAGEVEYVFKHALTREVAYNGLTKARRARLHADLARWIERVGEGRDEHAPLLAHHYAEAVLPEDVDVAWPEGGAELDALREKAVSWLERAAEASMSRYELKDAIALLERAVALEPDPSRRARLWRRLGRAHALNYDGDSFMTAIEAALELEDDPQQRSETYAELAFEGALRSGMWRRRPQREEMDEWTKLALAGVRPGSVQHVKALISRAFWGLDDADELSKLAGRLAEELGDAGLRSSAFDARAVAAFRAGDFEDAHTLETRRFDFMPELNDPDLIHDLYLSTIPTATAIGRIREARRLARELDEHVADLTTHHRLHGIACILEVEELAGDWDTVAALEPRTERLVRENRDTPCVRNGRSLLLCAFANELQGRTERARELEAAAEELQNVGYGATLATPRARLALLREELDRLEELLTDEDWLQRQTWFSLPAAATRLDVAAVIGSAADVESTAARLSRRPGRSVRKLRLACVRIFDRLSGRRSCR